MVSLGTIHLTNVHTQINPLDRILSCMQESVDESEDDFNTVLGFENMVHYLVPGLQMALRMEELM